MEYQPEMQFRVAYRQPDPYCWLSNTFLLVMIYEHGIHSSRYIDHYLDIQ